MSWATKSKAIEVGDKVAYTPTFLRSISCFTGNLPRAKGTVTALQQLGREVTLATIDWDFPDVPEKVNVANLCRVNSVEFSR